jgi:hypothetical protein
MGKGKKRKNHGKRTQAIYKKQMNSRKKGKEKKGFSFFIFSSSPFYGCRTHPLMYCTRSLRETRQAVGQKDEEPVHDLGREKKEFKTRKFNFISKERDAWERGSGSATNAIRPWRKIISRVPHNRLTVEHAKPEKKKKGKKERKEKKETPGSDQMGWAMDWLSGCGQQELRVLLPLPSA